MGSRHHARSNEVPSAEPPAGPRAVVQHLTSPGFWFLVVALCGLLIAGTLIFLPFWGALFLAAMLTSLLYPVFSWVLGRVGDKRRSLASSLTCALFVVVVLVPVGWLGLTVAQEATAAVRFLATRLVVAIDHASEDETIASYLERHASVGEMRTWVRSVLSRVAPGTPDSDPEAPVREGGEEVPPTPDVRSDEDAEVALGRGLLEIGQDLGRLAAGLLRGLLGLLFNLVLMLFLMFFFFRDGPQILRSIRGGLPIPDEYQEALIRNFRQVSRAMIRGIFLTAIAQGTVAGIAYFLLGIPAIFWGAMTGLCGMVPILGTGIVTVPIILSFVLNSQWPQAAVMAVVAAGVALMDNVLRPWLAKGGLQLHPVWILLSMLGGVSVFGPLGLVIGPMVVILVRTVLSLLFQPAMDQ